jgi:hypothetical protein
MITPITPKEAMEARCDSIPDVVIEVFNKHIAKNYKNGKSIVLQEDIVNELHKLQLEERLDGTSHSIFTSGWLDVEPIFRKFGWNVEYDKPAYCEDYQAFFTFTERK